MVTNTAFNKIMSSEKTDSFESLINQTGYKKVRPLSSNKQKVLHIKALTKLSSKEKKTTSVTKATVNSSSDRQHNNIKNSVLAKNKAEFVNIVEDKSYGQGNDVNFSIHSRLARKLSTGKVDIEATIDLHAHFVKEARSKLENFIESSYNKQLRNLLIITGKGSGKLREMSVALFTSKQHSKMIAGYFQAPSHLGGLGAFIVRLRREKKQ